MGVHLQWSLVRQMGQLSCEDSLHLGLARQTGEVYPSRQNEEERAWRHDCDQHATEVGRAERA